MTDKLPALNDEQSNEVRMSGMVVIDDPLADAIAAPSKQQIKKTKKTKGRTIFNSQPLLVRQLKDVNSSDIKKVIEYLTVVHTERSKEEKEKIKQQQYFEEEALKLVNSAKELGVPLEVLKKAISS